MRPEAAAPVLATLACVLALSPVAFAAEAEPPAARPLDTVKIQVMAVQATNGGPCDPRLEFLRARLRRIVDFRSFRLLDDMHRDVAWQETEAFPLPQGARLLLLPKARDGKEVLLQVRLTDGGRQLVHTVVRLRNRGYMIFGVEREARADQALLVVLRAED